MRSGRPLDPATRAQAEALCEVLQKGNSRQRGLVRYYLSLFTNTGPLATAQLADLAGGYHSSELERAQAWATAIVAADQRARTALRMGSAVLRLEVRVRPMLLAAVGLMRVARGHAPVHGSPRRSALLLAEATLFTFNQRANRWEGTSLGSATKTFMQEVANAKKARVLRRKTEATLRGLGRSVGAAGAHAADSTERESLQGIRNTVDHGDATFLRDGSIEMGLAGSWRTWVKAGKIRKIKKIPAALLDSNLRKIEGLLCIASGFAEAAKLLV